MVDTLGCHRTCLGRSARSHGLALLLLGTLGRSLTTFLVDILLTLLLLLHSLPHTALILRVSLLDILLASGRFVTLL
jgi:hypothetical protein